MHTNLCYPKPILYSNSTCNNFPMQRARGFNVYRIFYNTWIGMHQTGFIANCNVIPNISDPMQCDTEHFGSYAM